MQNIKSFKNQEIYHTKEGLYQIDDEGKISIYAATFYDFNDF